MKLTRFNNDQIGRVDGDIIVDITDYVCALPGMSLMRALVTAGGVTGLDTAEGEAIPLSESILLTPVPDPTKIIAAPVNYVDHQQEMNEAYNIDALGFFLKAPSSIVGPHATVSLPYTDRRFDQEGELAVIIGSTARHVSRGNALDYVFGYTSLLDITMRGGEDRSTRKSFETFTPVGPWIVTPDEFGHPSTRGLRCTVSGELRQDARFEDLIWDVEGLISYASSVTTLNPGDIIATGTPAGVGPIFHGDTISVTVDGIGHPLEVTVSDAGAVSCPTRGKDRGPIPPKDERFDS